MQLKIRQKPINIFLFKTQNTILSATLVLALTSGISAILGFIKTRLLTLNFGVSNELAVFYTADRIPNLMYSVLIVGAISTVFIPVFTGLLKNNKEEAYSVASSIINTTLLFFLVAGIIMFAFAPQIIRLLSVGSFTEKEIILGTNLMRIMLASQTFLVAGSLTTSILQSFSFFAIPALAPVVYNLGMIGGIIFLSKDLGIYGPAVGVAIGSALHIGIQLPLLKKTGFKFSPSLNLKNENFKKMTTLVPPRIISVLISNLTQTINNSLAILVSTSSVIFLKFADQLQTLPITLFGISMAAASLPTLSSEGLEEDKDKYKETFLTSFHQMMYLVMPLSMILLILRVPAVRIVYGVYNFPWEATIKTAHTLAFFSIAIFAQSANYLITRAYYALKDTITPVTVNISTAIINVLISLSFVTYFKFGVWSIALAYSITSIVDMVVLLFLLDRKVGRFDRKRLVIPFVKIAWSTAFMGMMLYIPMRFLDEFVFDTTRTINLIALTLTAGVIGMGTYLLITSLLKVEEVELLYKLLRRLKISKNNISTESINLVEAEGESL
ncbi:MAG: murein biosynthesis integral membrane protein MurJ [Patescibacteria group bacterium]